jgi:hypothetical protein
MHLMERCSFSRANSFHQIMSDCCIRQPFVTSCYVLRTYVTNTKFRLRAGKRGVSIVLVLYVVQ